MKTKIITIEERLKQQRVEEPLTKVIRALSEGVKEFREWLEKTGDRNSTGTFNARGDKLLVADKVSDKCFRQKLLSDCPGLIAATISEDRGFEEINRKARYLIALDPMDGSKNLLINGPFGSIAMVVEKGGISGPFEIKASVVATYSVYTDLYVALPGRVDGYTLNETGQFVLTHPEISIPKSGKILVLGKPREDKRWPPSMQERIAALERDKEKMRNFGAFVCDCINLLLNGGIFLYPDGKLLLLCELMALAFLMEQARGAAVSVDGQPIVEQLPQTWDDWKKEWNATSGIFIGSPEDVEQVSTEKVVSLRKAA